MVLQSRITIIFVLSFCFVLSGCSFFALSNNNKPIISNEEDQLETLLFSNDTYLETEKNYYNALLDIQKDYPSEVHSFDIIFLRDNKEIVDHYEIKSYPTLLIINEDKVLVRIEGEQSEENIYKEIENVYNK
jgi:hypothetical protein